MNAEPLLLDLLRCPRCRARVARHDDLVCDRGHRFPVRGGVPQMVEMPWSADDAELVASTGDAFGRQWSELARDALVGLDDLRLHLPDGMSDSVFTGRVLDAGCGMGRFAALVSELGGTVVGIDLSAAVTTAAALWPEVAFVQADLAAAPFAESTFDTVYSFGVLHHLPDPLTGFRRCLELVRPGGLLLAWVYSAHGGLLRGGRRALRHLAAAVPAVRRPLAWGAAMAIVAARRLPGQSRARPRLGYYDGKSFRALHVDCHDALAAPREIYLSADDCARWLEAVAPAQGGFQPRRDGSGWLIWVRRTGVAAAPAAGGE